MTSDFNYKKYSLENLENWMHDAMSSAEATPQEIYDVIKGVVEENYYTYKHQASQAYELLALLNGNGKGHIEAYDAVMREKEYYEPSMPPWGHSDMEALRYTDKEMEEMCDNAAKQDKVVKWQLPVEEGTDCITGEKEYFITFPDDLLEAANLEVNDEVEWVDNDDGSFLLRKTTQPKTYDEMIVAGYTMTADGFWIKE
jgi:hypothetical protein